ETNSDRSGDVNLLRLVHESGSERPLIGDRNGLIEITRLDETGVYQIRDGNRSLGEFAVNFFDDDESTLSGLSPGERQPRAESEESRLSVDDPYSWLMAAAILILLAAILADWYVLRSPRMR